ncbi:YafY family transcriptional regulator [Clostridium sp. chh4-2]|uniref:helix-turn-helix transcriptional regulator n=1 Tax=Clostridium sp. chh4-2 TaxID=2067550 RepID=UPI000CCFBE33|nr:YafY family protein [Clostridium sp. chh4-2]PNV59752.1 YafY family transcriptional regulator [Clostridium sp. chh4-2]
MQINRLFEIVYILLNQKMTTAKELADYFEVSRRTILRDIETLSQSGIPVYTTPGKGGGISILDNFILNKAAISDEEQNHILFALQSLGSTEHIEVTDIISKLQVLFDKMDTNWIEVDFSRWGNTKPDKEKFETLKSAIIKKLAVSFTYPNSCGEITARTAYPLKLVFKSKAWYLQAYCCLREDYRTFKINRILSLNVLTDSFAGQDLVPPPVVLYSLPSGLVHLTLNFSSSAAYRVYDEFDMQNVTQNSDGSYTVTVDLPDDSWLYSFLLSFGSSVKIIEPQFVKENLIKEVEKLKTVLMES